MIRKSLDLNALTVESFSTTEMTSDGTADYALKDTIYDPTCAKTCGATCGYTCDGELVCGFQSLMGTCNSDARAC